MHRAPIPSADMATYLREMRGTPSGPLVTSKLIANQIQANSEAQALQAFQFLETALESETEGSLELRTEVGRYRFLNEIIRILSPKYLANQTSAAVKDRAIRFLAEAAGQKRMRWFPSENSKINAVYQSLIESGIIRVPVEDASLGSSAEDLAEAELAKSVFERTENAAALKRLLASKDPADLHAANRLIKNLVDEEAKRSERRAELSSLTDRISTTTALLQDLLSPSPEPSPAPHQLDNKELLDDLADTLRSLRLKLAAVATETGDEATALLEASQSIETALELYEDRSKKPLPSSHGPSPLTSTPTNPPSLSLADQLLMGISPDFALVTTAAPPSHRDSTETTTSLLLGGDGDGENLLLNLDVEIKGEGTKGQEGQTPYLVFGGAETGEESRSKGTSCSFSEIERMSRELLEEGLRDSKVKGQQSQRSVPGVKCTLSQLQQKNNENIVKNNLSQSPSTPALIPNAAAPPLGLSSNGVLNRGISRDSDVELLDLDFLDNFKPKPPLTPTGEGGVIAATATTTADSSSGRSAEDDTLLLPLEDTVLVMRKGGGDGAVQEERGVALGGGSFSLSGVKEVDLEEVEFVEEVEPTEVSLEEETEEGGGAEEVQGRGTDFDLWPFTQIPPQRPRHRHHPDESELLRPPPQLRFSTPSTQGHPGEAPCPFLHGAATLEEMFFATASSDAGGGAGGGRGGGGAVGGDKLRFILSYCLGEDTSLHNGHIHLPAHLLKPRLQGGS